MCSKDTTPSVGASFHITALRGALEIGGEAGRDGDCCADELG